MLSLDIIEFMKMEILKILLVKKFPSQSVDDEYR